MFYESIIQNLREGTMGENHVLLSEDTGRELTIPITVTRLGGASPADYNVANSSVIFEQVSDSGEVYNEDYKIFQVPATVDGDDDGESIVLGFGTLPDGVAAGERATIRLDIVDDGVVPIGLPLVGIALDAWMADYVGEGHDFNREGFVDVLPKDAVWRWQRSATEFGAYSDVPSSQGGTSNPYTPSASDLGMWLKAKATCVLEGSTGHSAETTTVLPVPSRPVLSNASHIHLNHLSYGPGQGESYRRAVVRDGTGHARLCADGNTRGPFIQFR